MEKDDWTGGQARRTGGVPGADLLWGWFVLGLLALCVAYVVGGMQGAADDIRDIQEAQRGARP